MTRPGQNIICVYVTAPQPAFYLQQILLIFLWLHVMATGSLKGVPEVKTVSDANTQFGLELFRKCVADRKDENLFLAPFSISTALALTQLGAGGATAAEMAKALKWPSEERPLRGFGTYLSLMSSGAEAHKRNSYVLSGAQRIFVSQSVTLKKQFNSDAQQYFGADAKTADFQSNAETERKSINTWVSEKTLGKIQDLLPPGSLNSLTAMVLVQATYFKGFWLHQFDPKKTVKGFFKGTKGKVEVDMMSQQTKFPYARSGQLSCSAVELPYARGDGSDDYDLSMLILLPDEDDGLAALEASLTASDLAELRSSMTTRGKVNLQLPRFSMESSLTLKEVLISLGMVNAFSQTNADFTGLVEQPSEDLYISEVYHKALVEITEEGSEAAATTGIAVNRIRKSADPYFVADHPFLFLIIDIRANIVLFMGQLAFVEVNEEGSEAAAATGAVLMLRSMPIIIPFVVDHPFLFFIIDRRADIALFMGRMVNPVRSKKAGNQEL